MADRTSKLNLQYIVANQSQKEVTINADLNVLDMLVQATAKGIANAPPAPPAEGDMYIIGDAPDENGGYTVTDADTGETTPYIAKYLPRAASWVCVEIMDIGA
mgnify:CR=1 FL=1